MDNANTQDDAEVVDRDHHMSDIVEDSYGDVSQEFYRSSEDD